MQKWFDEDDDGFNLVIIDGRRKRIEERFRLLLSSTTPTREDDHGNKYYAIEFLDALWPQAEE